MTHNAKQAERILRELALAYPETHEDFPWGERVIKVNKKVFVFMGVASDGLKLSLKLPNSNVSALDQPFAQPTGYGLGKSGWVSVSFEARDTIPLDLLRKWLDESYRAVAPKKLVAALDATASTPRATPKNATKRKVAPRAKRASK
jgi:predicted DNA-binding protein (MmcQ/YjbR family)